LSEGEGGIAVEVDGADPEIGAAQVNCQEQSLDRTSQLPSSVESERRGSPSRCHWARRSRRSGSGSVFDLTAATPHLFT
jgi:hypothetical protein